jgi:hypothetical protein
MMKGPVRRFPPGLCIVLGLLACAVAATLILGPEGAAGIFTDPAVFVDRIVLPMLRLTFFISAGLFLGQIIESRGWTGRLTLLARPFMRTAHMSHPMGAAFTTAFVSGTASLSMLMEFHTQGALSRRELTITVLLNTFPSFFLHLPTTFFVLISLVGHAGLLYVLLTLFAAVIRLLAALAISRALLPPRPLSLDRRASTEGGTHAGRPFSLKGGMAGFRDRIIRILSIVLPVYMVVVMASDAGLFSWLRGVMAGAFTSNFIPVEAFSVVLFSLVAEFTSGYAAAGAMLESGALSVGQTVIALLLGNILSAPVRALRHQLPYYMGIFTPGLGLTLIVLVQVFRTLSLALAGGLFVALILLL